MNRAQRVLFVLGERLHLGGGVGRQLAGLVFLALLEQAHGAIERCDLRHDGLLAGRRGGEEGLGLSAIKERDDGPVEALRWDGEHARDEGGVLRVT